MVKMLRTSMGGGDRICSLVMVLFAEITGRQFNLNNY